MKHRDQVIVVGGGHAGVEAAHASARMGIRTILVTHRFDRLGEMSCNPAIGGLGKGHLVREIDALDGVMGRAADKAGIQFRLLNRRKGPAVRGPRAQIDRHIYREVIQSEISGCTNLTVVEGEVAGLLLTEAGIHGVRLSTDEELLANAIVLTTGTFLNGVIHIGHETRPAGRMGDAPSNLLADQIYGMGLPIGRLKTGTPPRLDGKSIDWDRVTPQDGDVDPVMFSFLSTEPAQRQIACGLTRTNDDVHSIIRENLSASPMYSGRIDGTGPRYCPAIEDKVVRFNDKSSHQIFLEPESLTDDVVYPNGISTSLPADVQEKIVGSIEGLENTKILRPGYAIEYDYVDPRALTSALQVREIEGLFLAGQINGTTGYEEAGAQGLVAGANAARLVAQQEEITFSRATSYIGVLVDDLVTKGVTEPYRMFTSRAEYRLSLRADNADQRLTAMGVHVGLVGEPRKHAFFTKRDALESARKLLDAFSITPSEAQAKGFRVNSDGVRRTGMDLLSYPNVSFDQIRRLMDSLGDVSPEIGDQLEIEAQYAQYVERQHREAQGLIRDEGVRIPASFSYKGIAGLSAELCAKLDHVRPDTLGQAGRIEGMTPAGLTLILTHVRRGDFLSDNDETALSG